MKKFRVLLLTAVLAVAMMAGSMSVFAADTAATPTTGGPIRVMPANGVPITKTVKVAEGITFSETITVTATQIPNHDGVIPPNGAVTDSNKIVKTGTIAVTEAAKTTAAEGAIDFSSLTAPGEYTFLLEETGATEDDGGSWSVTSTQKYYLQVLVKSNGDQEYALSKGDSFEEDEESENKVPKAAFENTYVKEADLEVTKTVVNPEYVDADTLYEFTVTFTAPETGEIPTEGYVISAATKAYTDAAGQTAVVEGTTKVANNGKVYLKDGGSFKIEGLPAGVTYSVTEAAVTNVTTTVTLDGTASENGKSSVLDENGDVVAYTNTYKQITVTGVIMNILPFVMMIAIAGGAAALYVVSRRRKMAR